MFKSILTVAASTALLGLVGCASPGWEPVIEPLLLPDSAALAVLAVSDGGSQIVIFDEAGVEVARHWTGLDGGDALVWDPANERFIVRDGGTVQVVVPGQAIWAIGRIEDVEAHGMSVSEDGRVFVAVEGQLAVIDGLEIEEISDVHRCFWDVARDGNDSALSIDVMAGSVARWDVEEGVVQDLFVYTDEEECWHEPGVVGRDDSGGVWVARTSNAVVTFFDGDLTPSGWDPFGADGGIDAPTARTVGRLTVEHPTAQQALSIAPAGPESVHVLYTGTSGEGVVSIDRSGESRVLAEAGGEIWVDLVPIR